MLEEDITRFNEEGGVRYFEITLLEISRVLNNPVMAIGFVLSSYPAGEMPGYRSNSLALHLEDGHVFNGASVHTNDVDVPRFKVGDVIGAGIDVIQHKVYWTLNGELLVSTHLPAILDFHAAVGLNDSQDCVAFNFGKRAFRYKPANLGNNQHRDLTLVNNTPSRIIYISEEDKTLNMISTGPGFAISDRPILTRQVQCSRNTQYFEVEILEHTPSTARSNFAQDSINVGWATPALQEKDAKPGTCMDSYCYGSSGLKLSGWTKYHSVYGPKWKAGDVVGRTRSARVCGSSVRMLMWLCVACMCVVRARPRICGGAAV